MTPLPLSPSPLPDPVRKIDKYINENHLRIRNFVEQMDSSGDAELDCEELQAALRKVGLDESIEQCQELVEMVDKDLQETQYGSRKRFGMTHAIHCLRRIAEHGEQVMTEDQRW